jgi:hypothetical protein
MYFEKNTSSTLMKFKLLALIMGFAQLNAFAHVQPESPLGGEHYYPGTNTTIKWFEAQDHGENNWDLYYSIDDSPDWIVIAVDLPEDTLEYVWTLPTVESNRVKVRIVQDNKTGTDYESVSNFFTISVNPPEPEIITGFATAVHLQEEALWSENYPNPFSTATDIHFSVPNRSRVVLTILNLQGKIILQGSDAVFNSGEYHFTWKPGDIPSGIYLYRINIGGEESVHKMIFER